MVDWAAHMGRIFTRLGEDVTYTRGTGSTTVRGVFLSPFEAAGLGVAGVTAANPHFALPTSDLPSGATAGDTISRGAITYTVRVKKPEDPGGFTVLELRR